MVYSQWLSLGHGPGPDEKIVWFYVEPLTLHLNRDGAVTYCPHSSGSGPAPVPVPDTASVITP